MECGRPKGLGIGRGEEGCEREKGEAALEETRELAAVKVKPTVAGWKSGRAEAEGTVWLWNEEEEELKGLGVEVARMRGTKPRS